MALEFSPFHSYLFVAGGNKLPLSFMNGLTIELELVNNYTDVCLSKVIVPVGNADTEGANPDLSTKWMIQECVIKADQLVLDSEVQDVYTKYMMSGKTIPIPFTSFINQVQVCNGDRPTISLSRSFTRLEAVYVTFFKTPKNMG